MPNLIDHLKRIKARCTKPTKADREGGCCGYLLGHADIGRVVELYDAAIGVHGDLGLVANQRLRMAIHRMRESGHAG